MTVTNNNAGGGKSSNPGSPTKSQKANGVQNKKPKSGKENGIAKESSKKPATLEEAVKKVKSSDNVELTEKRVIMSLISGERNRVEEHSDIREIAFSGQSSPLVERCCLLL